MAILVFMTEYQDYPQQQGSPQAACQEPGTRNASSPLTVTTHVEMAACDAKTNYVKIHVAGGNVSYSASGNATTSDMRMPADHTEVLGVRPGAVLSFVTASQ